VLPPGRSAEEGCTGRRRHAADGRQGNNGQGDNEDLDASINMVRKALQSLIRQIAENAGVEGLILAGKVMHERSAAFGYDV